MNHKYIITYSLKNKTYTYGFAQNKKEAKQLIINCIKEKPQYEIFCYSISESDIDLEFNQ